jgi:hypothetical protein
VGGGATNLEGPTSITGGGVTFSSGTINTSGTTSWSGNTAANGNTITFIGATLNNTGTWQDTNPNATSVTAPCCYSVSSAFDNFNVYNKIGAGTTTFSDTNGYGPFTFNNSGTVNVGAGTLILPYLSNLQGTTLYGGTFNVASTLEIGGNVVIDNSNVSLSGKNAALLNSSSGTSALASLEIIGPAGSFSIANGANFTTTSQFFNAGTLAVGANSTFSGGPSFLNFAGTTLATGNYNIAGTFEFAGANIVTNAANLTLSGASSRLLNSTTAANGLANFANNAAGGSFALLGGRTFTTAGSFANAGTLSIGSGSSFVINGSLRNLSGTTLSGGSYNLGGTLTFAGANVATNAASISLTSPTAKIVNSTNGTNALTNFANNAAAGNFSLSGGASFTTAGAFTNNGSLSVGSGSTFAIKGALNNLSAGTLAGGTYTVSGTLQATGANIVTNAANLSLVGSSAEILNSTTGNSALASFAANTSTGNFAITGGESLSTAGPLANAGIFSIGSGSTFKVGGAGSFTQSGGTLADNGKLVASGGVTLSGGSLTGTGTVSGNLLSSGVVTPGVSAATTGILTDIGGYTQNAGGSLKIAIGGTTVGSTYDALNSTTAALGGALSLSDLPGFVPTVGSTFKILNFNSETGKFATVSGLTINATEAYTVTYQPTDVLLTVVSTGAAVSPSTSPHSPAGGVTDTLGEGLTSTHIIGSVDGGSRLSAILRDFNATYAASNAVRSPARVGALAKPMGVKRDGLAELQKARVR